MSGGKNINNIELRGIIIVSLSQIKLFESTFGTCIRLILDCFYRAVYAVCSVLNKSENAKVELFAIFIQTDASQ